MSLVIKDLGAVTAYAYAVSKGYTGTEEEFAELMAAYASVAQSAESSAEASAGSALEAEGYAVGKQDGTVVGDTSPYYHNNASWFADQASGSASTASSKAGEAAQSASDASGYKNTASGKADEAAGSATSAGNQALKSEGYAVGKQNGADVASGSDYYQNNAKYYSGQAAASAASAAASAASSDGAAAQAMVAAAVVGEDLSDLKTAIDYLPPIKNSTATGVDLDISDAFGNVLVRFANGHIQTKNFNSESAKVMTVASSGADYTSVRAAIEAAETAGASSSNPYIIQIAPGSYDILSEFTSDEIADNSFVGLAVSDGITLEGMGILRSDTVLYAEMDTTTYEQAKRNNVSTVNFHGDFCGLKNLTVKSKNMRYAAHDDTGSDGNATHIMENCAFFAESTTSGGYGNISYGAGTDGGKTFIFRDCDFGDLIHVHTGTQSKSNRVIMERCRAYGFTASDYASSVNNEYYINDSVIQWIDVSKGSNWTAQHLFIKGSLIGAMVGGWSGMQYETGETQKYQHPNISAYPRAVAMETTGRQRIKNASTVDATIGVCYLYDSTNDIAYVQHSGYICAELLGFDSADVGQYLVVGSGGALSLNASDTNAIGKVVCVNNAGQHFIRLGA